MTSYGAFTMLWQKILRSSIWVKESKETRLVWVTLLAMKDHEGRVFSSMVGLADAAKVTEAECRESVSILLAPDADDTSGVKEGRRIEEIPGGWQIVNHEMYRFATEMKRLVWKEQKANQRARKKPRGLSQTVEEVQEQVTKEYPHDPYHKNPVNEIEGN